MREKYFWMYESIKFKECFYAVQEVRAKKIYNILTYLTIAVSIFSVLVWSIAKTMPVLWAIVIAVAQFAQAFIVNLPIAKRITALRYLLPELKNLSLQVSMDWMRLDSCAYSDEVIGDLIAKYEAKLSDLEIQFTMDIDFPHKESILKAAEEDQSAYFNSKYPATG